MNLAIQMNFYSFSTQDSFGSKCICLSGNKNKILACILMSYRKDSERNKNGENSSEKLEFYLTISFSLNLLLTHL